MCICIDNELSTQCSIWAWLLAFSEWQEPLKKLPGFQRFRDDLVKVSFVTAFLVQNHQENPWKQAVELQSPVLTGQSSTAALAYGETVGNEKLEVFNGAPKRFFFMILYLHIGLLLQMLLIFQAHYYIKSTINMNANKLWSINPDTYLQFQSA